MEDGTPEVLGAFWNCSTPGLWHTFRKEVRHSRNRCEANVDQVAVWMTCLSYRFTFSHRLALPLHTLLHTGWLKALASWWTIFKRIQLCCKIAKRLGWSISSGLMNGWRALLSFHNVFGGIGFDVLQTMLDFAEVWLTCLQVWYSQPSIFLSAITNRKRDVWIY